MSICIKSCAIECQGNAKLGPSACNDTAKDYMRTDTFISRARNYPIKRSSGSAVSAAIALFASSHSWETGYTAQARDRTNEFVVKSQPKMRLLFSPAGVPVAIYTIEYLLSPSIGRCIASVSSTTPSEKCHERVHEKLRAETPLLSLRPSTAAAGFGDEQCVGSSRKDAGWTLFQRDP